MPSPIILKDISLSFAKKTCFENFSAQVHAGDRIAIIGRNGTGKSSLLKILCGKLVPTSGEASIPDDLCIASVEQIISDVDAASGGQRFNQKLTEALAQAPDVLLLDEPTNHLDGDNRASLIRMLTHYPGILIIVSHDVTLLRRCVQTFWHIDNNTVRLFTGYYDDYLGELDKQRRLIERELVSLRRDKQDQHDALMKEQKRAANSKKRGQKNIERRKWPTVVSDAKADRAVKTAGKKKAAIRQQTQQLTEKLSELRQPEIISPKFSLSVEKISSGNLLAINDAEIGYDENKMILRRINLSLTGRERVAIVGKNASGKSTLLKAMVRQDEIIKRGSWHLPPSEQVGYLDQHYDNLKPNLSVLEHLCALQSDWNTNVVRRHLNDFLFRSNEEVEQLAGELSGGERARLSLSLIAAKTPRLLILDEITNNLDLETKVHVEQVLREYPGATIMVSHDEHFLASIGISDCYRILEGSLLRTHFERY